MRLVTWALYQLQQGATMSWKLTPVRGIAAPVGMVVAILAMGACFQLLVVAYIHANFDTAIARLMPDDAFYYLKIARQISGGAGSVFSAGEPTNGYHPLWMAVLVALHLLTQPTPDQFVLYTLLLAVVVNVFGARALGRLLTQFGFGGTAVTFGLVGYLFSPWLVNISLTGLETPLFLALLFEFLRAGHRLLQDDGVLTASETVRLGVTAGLLMLARTDAVLFTAFVFVALVLRRGMSALRTLVCAGGLASAILSPWLLWNIATFGTIMQASGLAMPVLRQSYLPPLLSVDYWKAAWDTLANSLYWASVAPLLPHASYDQRFDYWEAALIVVIGVAAAALFDRRVVQQRLRAPAILFVPVAMLLVYYCAVRSFVQVWNISTVQIAALVLGLAFIPETWRPLRSVSLMLAFLPMTLYSLGNGYFLPQAGTSIANLREYRTDADRTLRICTTDAGLLGYFSPHAVVNLDGVVNNRALAYIRAGRLSEYTALAACDEIRVPADRAEFYDRNTMKACTATFGVGWFGRELASDGWWVWSSGRGAIRIQTQEAGTWRLATDIASASQPNTLTLMAGAEQAATFEVDWASFRSVPPAQLHLQAGQTELTISSANPGVSNSIDRRSLAIALKNFSLTRVRDDVACSLVTR